MARKNEVHNSSVAMLLITHRLDETRLNGTDCDECSVLKLEGE